MYDAKSRLIHLHSLLYGSRRLLNTFLQDDPSLLSLMKETPKTLRKHYQLSPEKASKLYEHLHSDQSRAQTQQNSQYNILTILEQQYPAQLRSIPDPPPVLYTLGKQELLYQMPSISVVGTRVCTSNAKKKMKIILAPLVREGWVLVSGLAKGIDSHAHHLAIEENGHTIGVLAFGFQHCYPEQNKHIMKEIARNHLLISEYPPHIPPKKWHFPERNRVISGLTYGTLVVEAKERSGSLITADQALEQGREVYAIPDAIWNEQSRGCHHLIQMGAKLVQNTYDLSEDWNELRENWCRFMSNQPNS